MGTRAKACCARRLILACGCFVFFGWVPAPGQDRESPKLRLRRPIALALTDASTRLLIANRDSGTLAVVDTQTRRVVAEAKIGRRLSDLSVHPTANTLVVTDEEAGELVIVERQDRALRAVRRLPVGMSPVSVRITPDGRAATVACLWPRRLLLVELAGTTKPTVLDLPFAPRRQLLVPGTDKLIVADAFGGKLAVIDWRRRTIESVRDLAIHNIRGLAIDASGKGLWLTHQVLHAQGHTTAGDIRTGNLLTNNVRRLALAAVLDPLADILGNDQLYSLGDVERGAGDPAEVAESPSGQILVTLAGVHEFALGRPQGGIWTRLPVGKRPTALVVDAERQLAYVANTFSDSIAVIDLRTQMVAHEIRLGMAPELQPEERGEMLFFDAGLSFEAWFSCHSCHTDGHTNSRLNDNFTDGSFGTPKRVLSLLGAKNTGPWAWDGRMPNLESQVRTSLKSTMQGPTPPEDQVRDVTAYLQTLTPPPSLLEARGLVDAEALKRGRRIFTLQKCATCHTPPAYTSAKSFDVGLRDEAGGTHFNPPSLRGLSQAGPYFHDNRAATADDVLSRYKHQLSDKLSEQEVRDLLHFLSSL